MLGDHLGQRRETSRMPEWSAETGGTPQAAASAATMPNASGKTLGITRVSAAGITSATSACSSRPLIRDPPPSAPRVARRSLRNSEDRSASSPSS